MSFIIKTVTKKTLDLDVGDVIASDPRLGHGKTNVVSWTVISSPTPIQMGNDEGNVIVAYEKDINAPADYLLLGPDDDVEILAPEVAQRAAAIAGMRQLIDFLELHPDLPIPWGALSVIVYVRDDIGDNDARVAEVDRIASILEVDPDHGKHYRVTRAWGQSARYEAIACDVPESVTKPEK